VILYFKFEVELFLCFRNTLYEPSVLLLSSDGKVI